jgi:glutathione synthase/RimK-type ligase-like ATP-grasp enzyme
MGTKVRQRAIFIIGTPDDPHSQCVADKCRAAGADCTILTEDHFVTFDFDRSETEFGKVCASGSNLAIWWRLKLGYFRNESDNLINQFIKREWNHTLESFEGLFPEATWVNPRSSDRFIRHKPNQINLARKIGFATPPTLITNDPTRLLDFLSCQPNGQCIYKPLSWFFDLPNKLLFTNLVDQAFIRDNINAVERAPGIYQTLIKKAYELRITVVDKEIFAVRINSQDHELTSLDWRRDLDRVPYTIQRDLPTQFKELLLSFHSAAKLVYGAYDFIVTPDDDYIFLEVNQVGQWLWLEHATEAPISAAIASALLRD